MLRKACSRGDEEASPWAFARPRPSTWALRSFDSTRRLAMRAAT